MSSIILYKKNKLDELGYIVLQYTKENKTKRKSLKFKMTQKDFDKTYDKEFLKFRRTTLFDYQRINTLIDEHINIDAFNDVIIYNNTFLSYFKERKDLKTNNATIKTYESSYKLLENYLKSINKTDIKLVDIDKDFALKLQIYALDGSREQSSVRTYFNIYKTIFNNAIELGKYFYSNPFDRVKFSITIKTKRVLNEIDIDKLINVQFDNKHFIESRIFLLQFFLNGSRLSDVMLLKCSDITPTDINITMLKTKQNLPITISNEIYQLLYEIIFKMHYRGSEEYGKLYRFLKSNQNEYLFKDYIDSDIFKDFNKKSHLNIKQFNRYKIIIVKYNRGLRVLSKQLELTESVSSHNARHTFTNQILKLNNVNVNDVRMMLGHNNLQTTQNYIEMGFRSDKTDKLQLDYRKQFRDVMKNKEQIQNKSSEELKKAYLEYRFSGSVDIVKTNEEKLIKPKRPNLF